MSSSRDNISALALNRLSVYLRCLRLLEREGVSCISSRDLARRFRLSAAQIRKDLAHFGELGIRGVGYRVADLRQRLESLLGLDHEHRVVLVGAGNLGSALARYPGFQGATFRIVAVFDIDPERVGTRHLGLEVQHVRELARLVPELRAEIGILAVPAAAAQDTYDTLVDVGIRAILNFAPISLSTVPEVPAKTVDLLIFMEELAYFLR